MRDYGFDKCLISLAWVVFYTSCRIIYDKEMEH